MDKPDEQHDRMISEHIMHSNNSHASYTQHSSHSHKRPRQSYESHPSTSFPSAEEQANNEVLTLAQRLRRQIHSLPERLHQYNRRNSNTNNYNNSSNGEDANLFIDRYGTVPVGLMRRYIEYAKKYVNPSLSPAAAKVLQRLYLTMRAEASQGQSIPITTRHLESLIRLAQARARMDLREEVSEEW